MTRNVPELDGVRGVAILLVIAVHWQNAWHPATVADSAVRWAALPGWLGVELFFVLSGFLITTGLLEQAGVFASLRGYLGRFYWRRLLRIFPVYYAALFAIFVVLPHVVTMHDPAYAQLQDDQIWYWLYGVNWLGALHGPYRVPFNTGHFWSLAVEEQFYLGWPLIVWVVGEARLPIACAVLWVVSIALRIVVPAVWPWLFDPPGLLFLHFDPLMAGALVAWAMRRADLRKRITELARAASPAVLLLAAAVMAFAAVGHSAVIAPAAVVFAGCMFLALTLPEEHRLRRVLRLRVLRSFGVYSYCLYVVHYPLITALDRVIPRLSVPTLWGSNLPYAIVYGVVLVTISYAIAALSYRWFERPLASLKDLPQRLLA